MNLALRYRAAVAVDLLGLTRTRLRRPVRPYLLALAYHRIGRPVASFDPELWSATPEDFDLQVKHLSREFDLITPDDLPQILPSPRGRYAMITFDDGYGDNAEVALPILTARGVRAAFFVTTGFIDGSAAAWWDRIARVVGTNSGRSLALRPWLAHPVTIEPGGEAAARHVLLRAYKSLPAGDAAVFLDALEDCGQVKSSKPEGPSPWMTWDQVRALRDAGMHVGGHSHTHPVMSRVREPGQAREVETCARRLEQELGAAMCTFSYPVGDQTAFDESTRKSLVALGVEFAFSYYGGLTYWDRWNPYDVRRVGIESEHRIGAFRAAVSWPTVFGQI
jgi:peptidoglycan/xylan/chitin deacetylase (PgdA/CDA1 family)